MPIGGETNASFTIPATLAANTYYFFCEVRASGGAASVSSTVATVTVNAPPDGSPENPFIVNDETTLKKVGAGTDGWDRNKHYRQTANITLTGNWTRIGNLSNYFIGAYDGGGYSITNLAIPSATADFQGMFGVIGASGVVKNVALINVSISSTGRDVGGIAGGNDGTIENCYVTGTVSGTGAVGGVTGINRGTIKNSYTTCTVTGSGSGVGGIAASNSASGTVEACYATGKITGAANVGGIMGSNGGAIRNCVALNNEVIATNVRRVVGNNYGAGLSNNYAREDMVLRNSSGNVTPTETSLTGKDGQDVSVSTTDTPNIYQTSFWNNTFGATNAALWDIENNRLPHLKTTGGSAFNEPQNPTIVN